MGITGYIPNTGRFKYEKENFAYNPEGDNYKCRNGKTLAFNGFSENDKRYTITQKDCLGCPFKESCIGDKKYMVVKATIDKPYYDLMHVRMQSRKALRLMKIRQSTVEPVIGTLVNYLGIKKVNSRGLDQANKCLTMAAIAYNLKKMLKYKPRAVKNDQQARNGIHKSPNRTSISLLDLYMRAQSFYLLINFFIRNSGIRPV